MHIVLTYFDNQIGPKVLISSHPNLLKPIESFILELMDIKMDNGFFEHYISAEDNISLACYMFEVKSLWARGKVERLMWTIVVDPIQKPRSFKHLLEKYIKRLQNEPNIYKALYNNSNLVDPESILQYHVLEIIFNELLQELVEVLREIILGKIMMVGIQEVGKTSIINYINTKIHDPNIRPTIGIHMTRVLFENYKVHIYDVGGQIKLRNLWQKLPSLPEAIIYVLDCSSLESNGNEFKNFFFQIIEYFNLNHSPDFLKQIPILILANKIDLLQMTIDQNKIEQVLDLDQYQIKYKIGFTSAKTGEGILKSFRWVIRRLLKDSDE